MPADSSSCERVPRLLLRLLDVAGAEVDLCEGGHGLRRIRVAARVERDPESLFELPDRHVGLAEQEVQAAEVVRELPDMDRGRRAPRTPRARCSA